MSDPQPVPKVIIVDDDEMVASTLSSLLGREGYDVVVFHSAGPALEYLRDVEPDVVLSDISMPGMTGIEMLTKLRKAAPSVPVIFMTGVPRIDDTIRAIELGAFRYLTKPVDSTTTREVIRAAISWGRLSRASRSSPALLDRAALDASLDGALATLKMVYQPIVAREDKSIFGVEALMRSAERSLPSPPAVLDAAEKLGRLHELGRHIRSLVAAEAAAQTDLHTLFVNLHSADLADPQLFDPGAPLSAHARSVVLEITERASLEVVGQLQDRLKQLRGLGYRIAIDDLGAGYAGLNYFAQLTPDVVKIDMSLTRGIDTDSVRQRIVSSMCQLGRDLDMITVAEGIETAAEFETVSRLGAELIQGYFIAKPGPYPTAK